MATWQSALDVFLEQFEHKDLLNGILVCGSIITGHASARSDLDVHLVLHDSATFRERGNRIANKLMIEYFANPPQQIRAYFKEDWQAKARDSMTQFATGTILKDDTGSVKTLKEEAKAWQEKPFENLTNPTIELIKYTLWDTLDSLEDSLEQNQADFHLSFWHATNNLILEYRQFLGYDSLRPHRVHKLLSSADARARYLLPDFPDSRFANLILELLNIPTNDTVALMKQYRILHAHVDKQLGGFTIDGWTFKGSLTTE